MNQLFVKASVHLCSLKGLRTGGGGSDSYDSWGLVSVRAALRPEDVLKCSEELKNVKQICLLYLK